MLQKVMLESGRGVVKGKGAANTFGLNEVTHCYSYWNFEPLFIFSIRRDLGEKKQEEGGIMWMSF